MNTYGKFLLLIKTSRPIFWIVPPIVFLGWFYSGNGILSLNSILQVLVLSIPYCILLFGINDIYDYETDKINYRKGNVHGLRLEKKHHKFVHKYVLISGVIVFLISIFTKNLLNIGLTGLLLFISYYYSAKPIRFKEIPVLDSIVNGLGFLLIGLIALTYTNSISTFFVKAIYLALGVSAIHAITTIVDYESDRKSKTRTFATYFGKKVPSIYAFTSFLLIFFFSNISSTIIRYYILSCAFISLIIFMYPSKKTVLLLSKIVFLLFIIMAGWYVASTF